MFKSGMGLGKRLTVIIAFMAVLAILSSSREVVDSVMRVTAIMADLTDTNMEQTAGIERVNESIVRMDEVTQQNAAMVEEASSAAQSMHNEADNLSNAISVFKLGDDGDQNHIADVQAIGHDT
jgi:methyl-accepting chemotaxis protein